jgi:hypothetical protein
MHSQEQASDNILWLLKNKPHSTVFGTHPVRFDAGELVLRPLTSGPGEHMAIFRHNKENIKEMREKVARAAGINVQVWTEYDERKGAQKAECWKKMSRSGSRAKHSLLAMKRGESFQD